MYTAPFLLNALFNRDLCIFQETLHVVNEFRSLPIDYTFSTYQTFFMTEII